MLGRLLACPSYRNRRDDWPGTIQRIVQLWPLILNRQSKWQIRRIHPIIIELQPFTRPGLGFEIDGRKLRKYGKRFFKLSETGLRLKVIRQKGLRTALELRARKEGQEGTAGN